MNQWELDLDLSLPCDPDEVALARFGTAAGRLEMKLATDVVTNADVLYLAACTLDTHPAGSNWVQDAGGLPDFICRIARAVHLKRGKSISNAIQIAVGVVKRWASGIGDVDPDTRAKAAKAVAEWEKKKIQARATPG